jgi:hypothetical protein
MVHDVIIVGGSFKVVSNLHTGHEYANVERNKRMFMDYALASDYLTHIDSMYSLVSRICR